ncbi:hypothetical protein Hdeb2414_s0001g00021971 [Helianthus debilis subsp. tardiflorus]
MPVVEAMGLVVGGSLSESDSMINRTNGHGSIGKLRAPVKAIMSDEFDLRNVVLYYE